jgi:hypothetical protein
MVFMHRMHGYETIMINCNPETVSADFDTADKLILNRYSGFIYDILRHTRKPELWCNWWTNSPKTWKSYRYGVDYRNQLMLDLARPYSFSLNCPRN